MLDKQETVHLYNLAQQTPPAVFPTSNETVNPILQHVLDRLECSPATILDARWNVIAWNRAAEILADFGKFSVHERNVIRIMFTNKEFRKTFPDWESAAQGMVARFRYQPAVNLLKSLD